MLLLRSLVFQFYFFASVAIASMSIFLMWPFPFAVRSAIARNWGKSMLWVGRIVCGLDYVIEGRENIPAEPPCIIVGATRIVSEYCRRIPVDARTGVNFGAAARNS